MVIAVDFSGLHAWADAMASILLIELIIMLLMVTALMFVLAMAARWLQMHVVPLLNSTVPAARQALEAADEGTERVIRGVAEVYGIRRAAETALQILLFGREGTRPAANVRSASIAPVSPPEQPAAESSAEAASPTTPPSTTRPQPSSIEPMPPDRGLDNMAANAG